MLLQRGKGKLSSLGGNIDSVQAKKNGKGPSIVYLQDT